MYAFMLVPVGDLFTYYKINDWNATSDSDWTTAGNVALVGGVTKISSIIVTQVLSMRAVMRMIPVFSVMQEIASLYFINKADGSIAGDDTNLFYGIAGFNTIVSLGNVRIAEKKNSRDRRQRQRD